VRATRVAPKTIHATLAEQKIKVIAIRRLSIRYLSLTQPAALQCKVSYFVSQSHWKRKRPYSIAPGRKAAARRELIVG
jgi:hypothetical protein